MSILIISGTNRPNSNTLRTANVVLGQYAALGADASLFSLTELPREIFEPTAYASKPHAMVMLQQRVLAASGLHVVLPEYNGSFPGVLKYFIDMLKFPESFEHKPVAFVGLAAGMWGALRAVEQLQGVFGYRNAHLYPDRVFIPGVNGKFDPAGALNDPSIIERLQKQAAGFVEFVNLLKRRALSATSFLIRAFRQASDGAEGSCVVNRPMLQSGQPNIRYKWIGGNVHASTAV